MNYIAAFIELIRREINHEKSVIRSIFNGLSSVVKKIIFYSLLFYVLSSAGLIWYGFYLFEANKKQAAEINESVQKDNENAQVFQFVLSLMKVSRADLSDYEKLYIAQTIVRVSEYILVELENRKAFAVLVAIESKFNKNAKSPVGAVGLSQVMPRYAPSFGKPCGIANFKPEEVSDPELNLLLGACQFKELLNALNNTALALVAYNSGQNSESIKELKSLGNIQNTETANYVSKFTYLKGAAEHDTKDRKGE